MRPSGYKSILRIGPFEDDLGFLSEIFEDPEKLFFFRIDFACEQDLASLGGGRAFNVVAAGTSAVAARARTGAGAKELLACEVESSGKCASGSRSWSRCGMLEGWPTRRRGGDGDVNRRCECCENGARFACPSEDWTARSRLVDLCVSI